MAGEAFHHAGHAVATVVVSESAGVESLAAAGTSCDDLHEHALRLVRDDPGIDILSRRAIECASVCLLSGPLAEERGARGRGLLERSADRRAALDLARTVAGGDRREAEAYLDWLVIRAKRLIGRPDVWGAISSLAAAPPATWDADAVHEALASARAALDRDRLKDHPLLDDDAT